MKFKVFISILILIMVTIMLSLKKDKSKVSLTKSPTTIAALDLITYFNLDEELGDKKFSNKKLQITGVLDNILTTIKGNSSSNIICHLKQTEQIKLSKYKPNDLIILKGKCIGFLLDVMMIDCEIIN